MHEEYCKQAITDDEGYELVTENNKCPRCGERRMDWLLLDDDDRVTCQTCLERYKLDDAS